jgi:hypothetical protein
MSLSFEDYTEIDRELNIYDVVRGGWEHEEMGYEFNANHVLKHLARDISRKDFYDPTTVETQIAPDSLQYAFRLARWTGLRRDLLEPRVETGDQILDFASLRRIGTNRVAAHELALSQLADHLHAFDHVDSRKEGLGERLLAAKNVGRLLVYSAGSSAHEFGFNLRSTFTNRLIELRDRFDIPQPEQ